MQMQILTASPVSTNYQDWTSQYQFINIIDSENASMKN